MNTLGMSTSPSDHFIGKLHGNVKLEFFCYPKRNIVSTLSIIWFEVKLLPLAEPLDNIPLKRQDVKFQNIFLKYVTFIHSQVQYIKLKINFLLIYPSCLISKILYSESTPYDYVRSEPSHKNTHSHFPDKLTIISITQRTKNPSRKYSYS